MKSFIFAFLLIVITGSSSCQNKNHKTMEFKKLTSEEEQVIINKGTERPFTGEFVNTKEDGSYTCKRCGTLLFSSESKFDSHCGWPSFDDAIKGAVKEVPDADGSRTEIVCSNCGAHLGHVFDGEGFTPKNRRHCVNSISLEFSPKVLPEHYDTAYFAAGCFWGVQHYFAKADGVISTDVGYMGGTTLNPSYEDVCSHTSGHAEVVRVIYDTQKTTFEALAKLFFEIHDFTQINRQGPDVGDQYRTEIYYTNTTQQKGAEELLSLLRQKGYKPATKLTAAPKFWKAETYHQNYYQKKGGVPYCHIRKTIF
jgi:peptide methionine sulfoxide reductase msrA/msrB